MIPWTKDSVRWFGSAGAHSGYHKELAELLLRRIRPLQTAYDLGAGSGELSLALARRGVRVTAVERQAIASETLRRRAVAEGLDNLDARNGDWTQLQGPPADLAILSFCGGVAEHWDLLLRLCRRALIILSAAPGDGTTPFGLEGYTVPAREPWREDAPVVREQLQQRGVVFEEEDYARELGQPLRDEAELAAFLGHYYGPELAARAGEVALRCRPLPDGGLYLPYVRRGVLFTVLPHVAA